MNRVFLQSHQDKHARCGTLSLSHADIPTPVFMPVATQAAPKAMSHSDLEQIGYRLILANTYHLYLRPGIELLEEAGGLHSFSGWHNAYLTDSGGFQVMSLKKFCSIYNEGAEFRSHIDGSKHFFTPEKVIEFQHICGSDVIMPLDVCTSYKVPLQEAERALELTQDWLHRSHVQWEQTTKHSLLFGIVQGNFYPELRKRSCQEMRDLPGLAIGGLCLGESLSELCDIVALCREHLPRSKPLYCMGIGSPEHLLTAIEQGADMFDCVFPTRIARNAALFTRDGRINVLNSKYKHSKLLINHVAAERYEYTLGYLHHLFKAREILACALASQHNLIFIYQLLQKARAAIQEQNFCTFKRSFLERYCNGKK